MKAALLEGDPGVGEDLRADFLIEEALGNLACAVDGYPPVAGVYAMFSGGTDSLTSTSLAARHPRFSGVVHINTGIGIEETREFVRETCAREGWPLREKSPPGRTYEDLVLEHGFPGPGSHSMMYRYLKERAIRAVVREVKAEAGGGNVILVTGVRASESERRMRNVKKAVQRTGSQVWVAPIYDWTALDTRRYIEDQGYPTNPASDLIHMSGECLCGSFARADELDEIELWFPKIAAKIRELEARVKAAGAPRCSWGWGDGFTKKAEHLGPLCSSCESRANDHRDQSTEGAVGAECLTDLAENEMAEIEEGKASFRAAVARRDNAQWAIGDAARMIAPMGTGHGGDRRSSATQVALETRLSILAEFVTEEIAPRYDLSLNTIRVYRQVAATWQPASRVAAAWSVHRELLAEPNRHLIRAGMTIREARQARRESARQRLQTRLSGETPPSRQHTSLTGDTRGITGADEFPISSADLAYERTRLGQKLLQAVAILREIAEDINPVVALDWPDNWNPSLDTAKNCLGLIENAIQTVTSSEHASARQA